MAEIAAQNWGALDEAERAQRRADAAELGIVGVEPGLPGELLALVPLEVPLAVGP